jgi:hypothetical protein
MVIFISQTNPTEVPSCHRSPFLSDDNQFYGAYSALLATHKVHITAHSLHTAVQFA